jgi:hypothetical protein
MAGHSGRLGPTLDRAGLAEGGGADRLTEPLDGYHVDTPTEQLLELQLQSRQVEQCPPSFERDEQIHIAFGPLLAARDGSEDPQLTRAAPGCGAEDRVPEFGEAIA